MKRLWRWIYIRLPLKLRVKANEWKTAFKLQVLKRPRGRVAPATEHDWMCEHHARLISGMLAARVIRKDGSVENYNLGQDEYVDEGPNTVTDVGVAAMVNDWYDASKDITSFNYHEMGTGGSPPSTPAVTVTTLVTPVETRSTGTKSKPAANQIRSVATITATASRTINEWGLFDASSGGTLWSSRWFTAIVLASGDAIEFTYTLTISSFTA